MTWSADQEYPGPVKYRIYRADGARSVAFKRVGETYNLLFRDTTVVAGAVYRYQVLPRSDAGLIGFPSVVAVWKRGAR